MKRKQIERWLLLEQSGELPARRRRRLARELETSEEARRIRRELEVLGGVVFEQDTELPPWAVARIAARLRTSRHPAVERLRVLKPVLALAACLILAVRLGTVQEESLSGDESAVTAGLDIWTNPLDGDLSRLERMVASAGSSMDAVY